MPESTVYDDGVRLTRSVQLRLPPELRDRMETAAAAEGLTLTEFARRAIAERVRTLEGSEPPAPQQPASSASQPSRNAQHVRGAKTSSARQPASAATVERRKDA